MKTEKIINYGGTMIQVVLFGLLFCLEFLSGYRAGLAQHLYYKKIYYVTHFYQGLVLYLQGILLILLTFFVVNVCLKKSNKLLFNLYKYYCLLLLLMVIFILPWTRELSIYSYLLMALELFLVFETVTVIWFVWRRK